MIATALGLSPEKVLKHSLQPSRCRQRQPCARQTVARASLEEILGLLSQETYHPIFWPPNAGWESLGRPPSCGPAGWQRHRYFWHWTRFSGPFPSSHPSLAKPNSSVLTHSSLGTPSLVIWVVTCERVCRNLLSPTGSHVFNWLRCYCVGQFGPAWAHSATNWTTKWATIEPLLRHFTRFERPATEHWLGQPLFKAP